MRTAFLLFLFLCGCASSEVVRDNAKYEKIFQSAINDPYVPDRIKYRQLTTEEQLNDLRLDLLNDELDLQLAKQGQCP